jgi:hypothetical protein
VAVMVYFLNFGPVARMNQKGMLGPTASRVAATIYEPIPLAYYKTPLQKPIGMYLHLWCPELFRPNGDLGTSSLSE